MEVFLYAIFLIAPHINFKLEVEIQWALLVIEIPGEGNSDGITGQLRQTRGL